MNGVQGGELMIDEEQSSFSAPKIRYEPGLSIGHNST